MEKWIFDLGIALILYLQTLGAGLATFMQFFTFLGTEQFFLFFAPAIYWCVDATLGLRAGLFLMISSGINYWGKMLFHDPRPYWIDPRVRALAVEDSFGIPSGHAQHAAVVWGSIGAYYRKPWLWFVLVLTILLIGISRPVLGMHFPSDVLAGWVIGLVLLIAFLRLEPPVLAWLRQKKETEQALAAFGFSLVLILGSVLIRLSLGAWTLPQAWIEAAARALPAADPIHPMSIEGVISHAGTFFGLALGGILAARRGGFEAAGPLLQRAGRFLVGLLGVFLIWYVLGAVFPRGEALLPYLLRYFRYALIGLWVTWLAPLVFLQLHLGHFKHDLAIHKVSPALGTYSDR